SPRLLGAGSSARDLRHAGLLSLLGAFVAGVLGGETQDHAEPLRTSAQEDRSMVSGLPAPVDCGAAPGIESEAARPLRLLRNHRQLRSVAPVPGRGAPALAAMAVASLWRLR